MIKLIFLQLDKIYSLYFHKQKKKSLFSDFILQMAVRTGLEPVISSVTGRHDNQLR